MFESITRCAQLFTRAQHERRVRFEILWATCASVSSGKSSVRVDVVYDDDDDNNNGVRCVRARVSTDETN